MLNGDDEKLSQKQRQESACARVEKYITSLRERKGYPMSLISFTMNQHKKRKEIHDQEEKDNEIKKKGKKEKAKKKMPTQHQKVTKTKSKTSTNQMPSVSTSASANKDTNIKSSSTHKLDELTPPRRRRRPPRVADGWEKEWSAEHVINSWDLETPETSHLLALILSPNSSPSTRKQSLRDWITLVDKENETLEQKFISIEKSENAKRIKRSHIEMQQTENNLQKTDLSPVTKRKLVIYGKSSYRGVYLADGKWFARITVAGHKTCLGRFAAEEDAARAYDASAFKHWKNRGKFNFPLEIKQLQLESPLCEDEIEEGGVGFEDEIDIAAINMDEEPNEELDNQDDIYDQTDVREEEDNNNNNNEVVPLKPISKMTMMERQAHWMAKKKETLEAQRLEKEKENEKYSFKPNTQNSKRTYQTGNGKPDIISNDKGGGLGMNLDKKESTTTASHRNLQRTNSLANNSNSETNHWNIVKSKVKNITSNNDMKKKKFSNIKNNIGNRQSSNHRKLDRSSSESALLLKKDKSSSINNKSLNKKTNSGGNNESSSSLNLVLEKNKLNEHVKEEEEEEDDDREDENNNEENEENEEDDNNEEEEEDALENLLSEEAQHLLNLSNIPYIPGEFWWRVEGGRGQHRVNDGGEFQMWSIYRRKDKSRDIKGVSMLVGRTEAPPYEEKVIQIMFDVDVWTEEEAFRWYIYLHIYLFT
mmetsp:Transcript_38024/g.49230  ORF Transcript_38024/g.49230 Transcript_38024/m.49230 type:complete len:705 (+) Transcript_38024:412-2526(+)